jgi:hypothetical protein
LASTQKLTPTKIMKPINPAKTALLAGCLLAASLTVPSLQAQNFTFTTIAGGTQGTSDGLNTNAQFWNPAAVAADSAGNLYVADQDNNLIRKITPSGANWTVTTLAGGARGSLNGTNTSAQFSGPTGIVVGSSGNLYVADQFNDVIRQITVSGTNNIVTTIAGAAGTPGSQNGANGSARFSSPTGLAVDGSGNLYVADEVNNAIRQMTLSGTNWNVTTIAGGASGSSDGTNTAAQFRSPTGVAVDSGGRVFVSDQFNNTIRLITPVGTNWVVTTIAGQAVSGLSNGLGPNACFDAPISVAVDTNDNVYVADLFNNAIRKLAPLGTNWAAATNWMVSTIGGGSQGNNNGTGASASFDLPFGVATDAYGDVYVADSANNAIRLGLSSANPAPTGGVEVMITPPAAVSAGAAWQMDGSGPARTNGAILSGLVPGSHYVNFYSVAGYTTPGAQTLAVTAHQTTLLTINYSVAIANAGSLQVALSPAGSVNAGAKWQVDSGALQTNGGIAAGLGVGPHILSFTPISGWTTPSNQTVTIANGLTTEAGGSYVLQTGSLQVGILPAAVVTSGAKWQVDGGTFQASGATLSGLLPGSHIVSFNTSLGWQTPSNQVVTITNALTTSITATYTVNSTQPAQLAAMAVIGGKFQYNLSGQISGAYVIQASADLVIWTAISTNTIPAGGSLIITDPNTGNYARRFYRAVNQ